MSDNQEAALPTNGTPADTSADATTTTTTTPSTPSAPETPNTVDTTKSGVLDSKDEGKSEVKPDWPEDWLDKLSGADEKVKNQLGRYASPKAVAEALIAAQKKISSYKPEVTLPEKPTDEDISKYRKAHGIPDKPEGYDIKLDNGIVIGDADKALVEKFLVRAHARHAKPAEVKAALQDHFENIQAQNEEITAKMNEQKIKAEDELRAEWGTNFRQNTNVISNFLKNKFGEEVAPTLMNAVLGDGTVLQNNPKVLRALLSIASDIDPIATMGGSAGTTAQSIDDELKELNHLIATDPDKYWNDQRKVDRYQELKATKEKLSGRA